MVFYVKAVVTAMFYSTSRSLRAVFTGSRFKKTNRKNKGSFTFFIYYTGVYSKKFSEKLLKDLRHHFYFAKIIRLLKNKIGDVNLNE